MGMTKEQRIEIVRDAVARATKGLEGAEYREFMELLLSDADGWKMELDETEESEEA